MSAWFKDEAPHLLDDAVAIALDFLDRTGEIDDAAEARQLLVDSVGFMIGQGERRKLLLANRAIASYQRYRKTRTIELLRVS